MMILLLTGCGQDTREEIVIAIPRGEFIRSIDTNYYKLWLEEQTGLRLTFLYMDESYTAEHLDKVFSTGDVSVDAFFSFNAGENYLQSLAGLQDYGAKGYILPLNRFLDGTTNLERIFATFDEYDLRIVMTSGDGNIYFMPGLDATRSKSTGQILWINKSWLTKLKMPIPQTTEELQEVLTAFAKQDPNGNGLADEIPLCGSMDSYSLQSFNAILQSFVYNDPENSRLYVENGKIFYAPVTEQWRAGLLYLSKLYQEGLLSPLQFELSHNSLSELVNSSKDIVGTFTSDDITDVLLQNSPEIFSNFTHLPPLTGPEGICFAAAESPVPGIAGMITSTCKNPEAVFALFDLMLSEEAFLIGRFGEENVDWIPADVVDMDFYNRKAAIKVLNNLKNRMQNKHITELGPFFAYPKYAESVTFTGFETDNEYISIRAQLAYEQYKPAEQLGVLFYMGEVGKEGEDVQILRNELDAYTEECIKAFITGKLDITDNAVWNEVLTHYEDIGYKDLVGVVQSVYDKSSKN